MKGEEWGSRKAMRGTDGHNSLFMFFVLTAQGKEQKVESDREGLCVQENTNKENVLWYSWINQIALTRFHAARI